GARNIRDAEGRGKAPVPILAVSTWNAVAKQTLRVADEAWTFARPGDNFPPSPVQLDRVHATPTTVAGARMPTPGPARRTARRIAIAWLLATAGCGGDSNGPVAPSGSGSYTPVSVGDTVAAMLPSGADSSGFTFRVSEPGRLALFGSADAPLQLFVVDSALQ